MPFRQAVSAVRWADPWMIIPMVLLFTTSFVVLFSIDQASGGDRASKQLIFIVIGLLAFFGLSLIRIQTFEAFGPWVYVASIMLLVGVLLFGKTINSTTGWFVVGPFSFQPVEVVKIFFIWTMAWYFSRLGGQTLSWKPIVLSLAALSAVLGLVFLQPDFGSGMMLVFIWIGMLVMVHRKKWHIALVLLGLVLAFVVSWFFLDSYQQNRLVTFIYPERDPLRSGYNVQQSIIATGSGQWLGRGLGLGPQSQLSFLPEQSTDFIFSVIAEELGFLGAGGVLLLFGVLLMRVHRISLESKNNFGMLVAYGVLLYFVGQIFINVGMNMGLAPVTGLPLPLISAGGSSILASCIALGLVQSIAKSRRPGTT